MVSCHNLIQSDDVFLVRLTMTREPILKLHNDSLAWAREVLTEMMNQQSRRAIATRGAVTPVLPVAIVEPVHSGSNAEQHCDNSQSGGGLT